MSAAAQAWESLLPGVSFAALAPSAPPVIAKDTRELTDRALADAGIEDFVRAAASARAPLTLVVNDPHRFTDTRVFMDALFEVCDRTGRGDTPPRVRVLVATGSHVSTPAERAGHEARILGPWAGRIDRVAWHDGRDAATLRAVGRHGFHRWMSEGGFYLACGSMEPHYFAGVTGAHKTLTVGVMSLESLAANHEHAMARAASGMKLAGNPVHEGIARALADLEATGARLLALNQLIVEGRVAACTAGDPLAALAAGLPLVRGCFSRAVDRPVDVIVACVGPPLDRDLYQADKGIKNTEAAIADRGVLIVEAGCSQGVGLQQFVDLLRAAPTHEEALRVVRSRGYRLGDHKAVRLRALTDTRSVRVGIVTAGLDPDLAHVLGMTILPDRASAAAWAARALPAGTARGLVVEDAGNLTLELTG